MLKSIDVLIGLSVVMLIVSMAVTLLSQLILNLLASRGRNLHAGLADILEVLGAGMSREHAEVIADKTLSHPVIGGKFWAWLPQWVRSLLKIYKNGDVIHREDFVNLLLHLGASYQGIADALAELRKALKPSNAPESSTAMNAQQTVNNDEIRKQLIRLYQELLKFPETRDNKFVPLLRQLIEPDREKPEPLSQIISQFGQIDAAVSNAVAPYQTLVYVLRANGVDDVATTVKNVQMLALQFEKSNPELAHDVRQTNALLHEASSEFLAKINQNFDQVMDRVSARFTGTTRAVSVFSSIVIAVLLQLDTVYVINRLAVDDALRTSLVQTAKTVDGSHPDEYGSVLEKYQQAEQAKRDQNSAEQEVKKAEQANAPEAAEKRKLFEAAKSEAINKEKQAVQANVEVVMDAYLANAGIVNFPNSIQEWRDNWGKVNIPGILISVLLLSLGAPFWYNALGKLLQLRSLLAQKDDAQKTMRQTNQAPGATGTAASVSTPDGTSQTNPLHGEKGDLNAVG